MRVREAVEEVDERRRTSRVRREKPQYYDSQQFEKKKKKKDTKVGFLFSFVLFTLNLSNAYAI